MTEEAELENELEKVKEKLRHLLYQIQEYERLSLRLKEDDDKIPDDHPHKERHIEITNEIDGYITSLRGYANDLRDVIDSYEIAEEESND